MKLIQSVSKDSYIVTNIFFQINAILQFLLYFWSNKCIFSENRSFFLHQKNRPTPNIWTAVCL